MTLGGKWKENEEKKENGEKRVTAVT